MVMKNAMRICNVIGEGTAWAKTELGIKALGREKQNPVSSLEAEAAIVATAGFGDDMLKEMGGDAFAEVGGDCAHGFNFGV